jgi:glycosyltransferase involved in cell wall biosynthesis
MSKHLAIVPAYNESGSIGRIVAELHEHATGFDVLVVDDGSTDDTARIARAAGAWVVRHPFNLGIGGAMQSGYHFALEGDYDLAVQVDGDGQHDPRQICTLTEELAARADLDMVTGSRFLAPDGNGYKSSATRRLGIRTFAGVLSWITGQRVTDPTSGFRLTSRSAIELFARDYPHDYPEVEAVVLIHAHRLKSGEVSVTMRPRASGVSSIDAGSSLLYLIKVRLAIIVGLFRARPAVEPGDQAPVSAQHAI